MSWWKRWLKGRDAVSDNAPREQAANAHRTGTAEFERFVAQGELDMDDGNLVHGAQHLGELLLMAPSDAQSLALAERYALKAGADAAEVLVPSAGEKHVGTEALRGWLWQREGRLEEAVDRIVAVMHANRGARRLHVWLLDWLEPAGAIESLPPELQMQAGHLILMNSPEARLASARGLWAMQRWSRVLMRLTPPEEARAECRMLQIGFLRRAGLFDEALRMAGPLAEVSDWHGAIAIGLVLRQQQRMPEAEAAFRRAIEFRPDDFSGYLEAADGWMENEDWARASHWYAQVLAREAEHSWAQPSHAYCQWELTQDEDWRHRVIEAVQAGNPRARRLWYGQGHLPEPEDHSASKLRHLKDSMNDASTSSTGLAKLRKLSQMTPTEPSLEAPSIALAFALEFQAQGKSFEWDPTINSIPEPDPRQSVCPVAYPLWRYRGMQAIATLRAPAPDLRERIAQLARQPYRPAANWAAASHVALAVGPASGRDRSLEVLACMVHPPALPADGDALAWLPRVQLVAAQVLAQIDEGWQGSRRRELLMSVLLGPSDWATCAAIRALAWIAVDEPAHALDIHQSFERLEAHRSDGYCCWLETLYESWQELPLLFDREREALKRKWTDLVSV